MNDSGLLAHIDNAFASGHAQKGLTLLREYNGANDQDAANWHRQAVIEEQIGDMSLAGEAHYRCIQIASNNAIGYLYAGYWLQVQKKQVDSAAALYSLALDIDASALSLWGREGVSKPTQLRSREANVLLRQVLSNHHRDTCKTLANAERIENAQWLRTSDNTKSFTTEHFSPELFFVPGLSMKPFYPHDDFEWAAQLSDSFDSVRDELRNAMQKQLAQSALRTYLDEKFSTHSGLSGLANSQNWLAIDLFKNGDLNTDLSDLFPKTIHALKALPLYCLDDQPFEVFFSFLKPHQSIASHYGQSNHALTVHLPLEIPKACHLNVGAEQRSWKENQVLVFDDSFLHSAHNESEQTRVVLIFSIWHPDLTKDEKIAIQESFKARQQWTLARQSNLQHLRTI